MDYEPIVYKNMGRRTFFILLLRWSTWLLASVVIFLIALAYIKIYLPAYSVIWQRTFGLGLLLIAIIAVCTYMAAKLEYRHYSVSLSDNSLEVKRGLLSVSINGVSYRRIRDIVTTRSFLERLLGVSTLTVNLLGETEDPSFQHQNSIALFGLSRRVADRIHDELLFRIGNSPVI